MGDTTGPPFDCLSDEARADLAADPEIQRLAREIIASANQLLSMTDADQVEDDDMSVAIDRLRKAIQT